MKIVKKNPKEFSLIIVADDDEFNKLIYNHISKTNFERGSYANYHSIAFKTISDFETGLTIIEKLC